MTRHKLLNRPFCPSNIDSKPLSRIICLLTLIYVLFLNSTTFAEISYTNDQIADAIFKAEGGMKAEYWYGIRSVKYDSLKEARRICLNTIRNQRRRHAKHECASSYLECLANRYCPVGALNDPHKLNRYWLKNVIFFLEKTK